LKETSNNFFEVSFYFEVERLENIFLEVQIIKRMRIWKEQLSKDTKEGVVFAN
jgi:hypothetical protein